MRNGCTISDIAEGLGVSRRWVYDNVDPHMKRLSGEGRKGRAVVYDSGVMLAFVADSVSVLRARTPYNVSAHAPDKAATAAAWGRYRDADGAACSKRRVSAGDLGRVREAYELFLGTLSDADRALLKSSGEYSARRRAAPVAVDTPGWLRDELIAGNLSVLRTIKDIQSGSDELAGKSLEIAYRALWRLCYLRVELFGRTYYVEDRLERVGEDGDVVVLVASRLL